MPSGIYKTKRNREFTTIGNELINNPDLSAKAKGILIYLLSKPDDWETRTEDIVAHMADGVDSIKSGLKELKDKGYMMRRRIQGDRGRFSGWETLVLENPMPVGVSPKVDFPPDGFTESGFSDCGETDLRENRFTGNPPLLNTDLTNTDLTKKEERSCTDVHDLSEQAKNDFQESEPQKQDPVTQSSPVNNSSVAPIGAGKDKNSAAPRKSKKRNLPAESAHHPEVCQKLWEVWSPMYIQYRGEYDSRKQFVAGFDFLIEQGEDVEKIREATLFYCEGKMKAIAEGRKSASKLPPDGIRFFKGKDGGESYCLRAYELLLAKKAGKPEVTIATTSPILPVFTAEAIAFPEIDPRSPSQVAARQNARELIRAARQTQGVNHAS